jgi:hypothetical protein
MRNSTLFSCAVPLLLSTALSAQVDILTQHYNIQRTGWNDQEQHLNTTNVKPGTFGKLFTCAVDDQVYGQPLIVSGVTLPGIGQRNVLYVATVNNTVYAFDADASQASGPYWSKNLTPAGARPPLNTDMTGACGGNYVDFSGHMGIVGTPVIDKTTNTLYLVSRTISTDGSKTFTQYLHAIDITTGAEKANSPKVIAAQVSGSGEGSSGGKLPFDPQKQNQRPGLLLLNGVVYIGFSSHCDWDPYHGWLLGYDASSLQQKYVYCSTPDGGEGGIWMAGSGPSVDEAGNIFVATGNGSTGVGTDVTSPRNRATSLLKLSPSLAQLDYFTPTNYATLNTADLDFGCSEVLVIPGMNRAFVGAKDGSLFLTDVNNLGGYQSSGNNVVQEISLGTSAHLRSSFGYYKGTANEFVYTWSENTALKAFPVNRAAGNFDLTHVITSGLQGPTGNNGANMTTSSNGNDDNTAILWATHANNCDANHQVCPGIVRAVNAANATNELWNSSMVPGDNVGNYAKFSSPVVANGKLYVSTFSGQIAVYGLVNNGVSTCTSANIAVGKTATASSIQTADYPAYDAVDGDMTTRWSSAYSDAQWIYVDLGKRYDLCQVTIYWETASGKDFDIQVSDDAQNWTTAYPVRGNTSRQNVLPLQVSGQYVRMNGITRNTVYGYSIWEMQVFGTPSVTCLPPSGAQVADIQQNTATISWNAVTGATGYTLQYKAVAAADWTTTTTTGTSIPLTALSCGTDYLYAIAATCSGGQTSDFTVSAGFSTAACPASCGPIPTRWTTLDIGSVGNAGQVCYDGSTFTLQGSGADIGGTSDQFRFAYVTLTGDDQFIGQVLSQDAADPADKVGIMIRQNLGPDAPNAFIGLTHDQGAIYQYRSVAGGVTTAAAAPGIAAPYWLKLVKAGSTFSGYTSSDGLAWTPVGATTDLGFGAGGSTTYAGLAITSHNNSTLSTASVDNFTQALPLPIGLTGFSGHRAGKTVVLEWSTGFEQNSDHFDVERSNDGVHFSLLATVPAAGNSNSPEQYQAVDEQPGTGMNYYRLKEVDKDEKANYSPIILVRFSDEIAPALFPNPVGSFFRLVAGSVAIREVNVYDLTGRKMLTVSNAAAGSTLFVPCSRLASGVYIVETRSTQGRYLQKMLKQ